MTTPFVPQIPTARAKNWVPAECDDVAPQSWWPNAPWTKPATGPVDHAATERLASIPGKPDVRASLGVPIQAASMTRAEVVAHHEVAVYGPKNVTLPMPEGQLRRTGDPDGSNSDRQAFLYDRENRRYYEVSNIIDDPGGFFAGLYRWARDVENWLTGGRSKIFTNFKKTVDRVSVFDIDRPWDAVRMNGTAAIKVPMVPMVPTFEEFVAGRITHALQFCATYYQPSKTVGYARGTDPGGTPSSPLIAGMTLRLSQRRYEQLVELWANEPHVIVLLNALREFGMVVADRTNPDAGHLLRIAQDPRIDLGALHLVITDFEVVQPN